MLHSRPVSRQRVGEVMVTRSQAGGNVHRHLYHLRSGVDSLTGTRESSAPQLDHSA